MGRVYVTSPGTQAIAYTATGTEGKVLHEPGLAGHKILLVTINTLTQWPTAARPPVGTTYYYDTDPTSADYQSLVFGTTLLANYVVQILYS